MSDFLLVYTTLNKHKTAENLSKQILEEKLAACVNIIPHMESFYVWEGKIQKDLELILLIKTRQQIFPQLEKFLRAHHPYTTPCIFTLKMDNINPPYAAWLSENTPAPRPS